MKIEQRECSETLAYKIQTPGITQKKPYNMVFKSLHYVPTGYTLTHTAKGTGELLRTVIAKGPRMLCRSH